VREQDAEASGETPTSVVRQVDVRLETLAVSLAAGHVVVDLYFRSPAEAAPLVVVAHGFWRSRANMAGWGRHLAAHGFVAAVPDLPAWSDHARNGRAINELIAWLIAHATDDTPVDRARIAVVGFSAGGLATLLAASDNPSIDLWIGLDPVDRRGVGEAAAARLRADAVIITAEPSSCNAHGNAKNIARAFGERATVIHVPGATHADAEWPSDWKARLLCGGTSPEHQASFVRHATAALESKLDRPRP
jgi:dienelactone hydrolase